MSLGWRHDRFSTTKRQLRVGDWELVASMMITATTKFSISSMRKTSECCCYAAGAEEVLWWALSVSRALKMISLDGYPKAP